MSKHILSVVLGCLPLLDQICMHSFCTQRSFPEEELFIAHFPILRSYFYYLEATCWGPYRISGHPGAICGVHR